MSEQPTEKPEAQEEKEEKELSPEEEDKKELYDAIKDLKPEEANDNIKAKLLALSNVHLEFKKIENDQYGKEYDTLQDKYDKQYQEIYEKIEDQRNELNKMNKYFEIKLEENILIKLF